MNTDTIKLSRGVNNNGGAYFCQNIRPSLNDGVFAGISMSNLYKRTANTATATMGSMTNFTQLGIFPFGIIFSRDDNGDIYCMTTGGANLTKASNYSLTIGAAEGLMIDTNGTLVYTGSQYIGRVEETTLDGDITIDASSVVLTDASDFPTSGYAFIGDMTSTILKPETISWTGKTSNTLTGVTRGVYNSTASSHSSGASIYYFKDNWKDLGASITTSKRRCIKWEDENFFINGNIVSGYSESDGSDFGTRLELSSDKSIVDLGILPTSATSYVLVCANAGENGYIYVWDGKDTATISEKELKNNNISRAWENYIATDNGIYKYDGTNLELITEPIEKSSSILGGRFSINDMKIVKNYLLFTGGIGIGNRDRQGFWFIDLETKDTYFVLDSYFNSNYSAYGIFPVGSSMFLGTSFNDGSIESIVETPSSRGSSYQILYNPNNSKLLQLKSLKVNVSLDESSVRDTSDSVYFDVIVRGFNFSKGFIGRSQLKSGETPSGSSQLIITSSLFVPSVGDRLEIQGLNSTNYANSAGAFRNITAVTAGTGKYIIDVDEDFPEAIDAITQNSSAEVLFYPLKKLGKVSVNSKEIKLEGYDILLLDQPRFKKMLFEIEIRCGDTTISPELNSLEVNYEILE